MNPLFPEKTNKKILTIKNKIKKVKDFKKKAKFLNSSRINDILDEKIESLLIEIKQLKCNHSKTTGLIYVGHDSHKDYYEDRCINCKLVLEYDDR